MPRRPDKRDGRGFRGTGPRPMPRVRTSPQPHPIRNRQDDELARATGPAYDIWRGAIRRRDAARRSAVGALVPRAILGTTRTRHRRNEDRRRPCRKDRTQRRSGRSEEPTYELQTLMRISYADVRM